jgi:hypothetical protein
MTIEDFIRITGWKESRPKPRKGGERNGSEETREEGREEEGREEKVSKHHIDRTQGVGR